MQKDSAEVTRKALNSLTATIKVNPDVLNPKKDDDDDPDCSCSCGSESRVYHLTLELNNALHEQGVLKAHVDQLKTAAELLANISATLSFNTLLLSELTQAQTVESTLSVKQITGCILALQTFHETKTKRLTFLKDKFAKVNLAPEDEQTVLLVTHYKTYLDKLGVKLEAHYTRNLKQLDGLIAFKHRLDIAKMFIGTFIFFWTVFYVYSS